MSEKELGVGHSAGGGEGRSILDASSDSNSDGYATAPEDFEADSEPKCPLVQFENRTSQPVLPIELVAEIQKLLAADGAQRTLLRLRLASKQYFAFGLTKLKLSLKILEDPVEGDADDRCERTVGLSRPQRSARSR